MCLGVPCRVVRVLDAEVASAVVDAGGVLREISTMLVEGEVGVGDWVLVHVGFALCRVEAEDARETLALLEAVAGAAADGGGAPR